MSYKLYIDGSNGLSNSFRYMIRDGVRYIEEQQLAKLKEENEKLTQVIKKLDLIIESDKFEGWSDQYHEMRQAIDSLKESNEKK